MKGWLAISFCALALILTGALTPAHAALSLEDAAEYCQTATRQLPEEVQSHAGVDLGELAALDDAGFVTNTGRERSVFLGIAGDWADIEDYVLEQGLASASAIKTLANTAFSGRAELVKQLLELGVPPDRKRVSEVPLIVAATCGYNHIAEIFLRAGADPNRATIQGQDAMLQAVVRDNQALGELLVKYGYDPCVMELDDGRNLNDMIDHMGESSDDYPAFWQDFKCREDGPGRSVQ